ncbi:MAG: fimbrillin family protein [Tannerellaceae bacterium]|nr:fimbrillin family protein [Tannerellaceae bacterium]
MHIKKKIFQLFAITLFLGLFHISCSEDRETDGYGKSDLMVVIDAGMTTKAVDADWESGDAIGVTMYDPAYTAPVNGAVNKEYVTGNSGDIGFFQPATESETLYFPQDGSSIRLKSYYPYRSNMPSNMQVAWSVIDQTVLEDIDLMTAEHLTGFSKEDTRVELHFYHRLSKLIFRLSTQDDVDFVDLADCTLTIRNAELGNTYDILNDRFLDESLGEGTLTIPTREGEPGDFRQAIVMPRPAGEGYIF